jgi:hypothetical protein
MAQVQRFKVKRVVVDAKGARGRGVGHVADLSLVKASEAAEGVAEAHLAILFHRTE